jgi:hypothetical protein
MLSRRQWQWQWLSDHQIGVNKSIWLMIFLMIATYIYNFIDVFFWNNKIPIQRHLDFP